MTGHLERWGYWGFVVRPERAGDGFHVLAADGQEVATGYRGDVVGVLNQRLVVNLAGRDQSPVFIFADNGQAWPMFALTDTKVARSVADGGVDNAVAIQVSDFESDVHEIRIYPGSGAPRIVIPTAESAGGLRWSADGNVLYFVNETDGGGTELVQFEVATKRRTSAALSDGDPLNHWSSAIAVRTN